MTDIFVSYSRRNMEFVRKLHKSLEAEGRSVWVDWENIPLTAEWLEEIYTGIEAANVFAFVITPELVRSEVCSREIAHAIEHNKRLVPILREELEETADKAALHPSISSHNWIFFREQDPYDELFKSLTNALDTDLEHLQAHTRLLIRAVEWNDKQRDTSFLLRGSELQNAVDWLKAGVLKEPDPTSLHHEYITASQRSSVARRRLIIATVLYGFTVLILAIFAFYQAQVADTQRQEAEQQEEIAVQNASTAVAAQATSERSEEEAKSLAQASNAQQALYRRNNPDLAIALALEANSIESPPSLARTILAQAAYFPGVRIIKANFADYGSRLDIHPNDRWAISVNNTNELVIWDIVSGEEETRFRFGESAVQAMAFHPDGNRVIASNASGITILYDLENDEEIARVRNLESRDLIFSNDGQLAIVGTTNGELVILSADTGEEIQRVESAHSNTIRGVAVNADDSYVVTGSEDGLVIIWDLETLEIVNTIDADAGQVWSVDINASGTRILAGYEDSSARLWNAENGEEVERLLGHSGRVWDVILNPDGQTAITSSQDSTLIQWNLVDGSPIQRFYGHTTRVYGVDVTSNGQKMVTGGEDGTVRVWDTINGAQIQTLKHQDWVWDIDFYSDEGRNTAVSSGRDGRLIWWDLETGEQIRVFEESGVNWLGIDINHDGTQIVSASFGGSLTLWDAETGEAIRELKGHRGFITSVVFSPDGRTIVSSSDDRQVILWDTATGIPIRTFKGHSERVWDVVFSPDGSKLLSSSTEGIAILWDVESGSILHKLIGHGGVVYSVAFSPDGQSALTGSEDRTIWLWDVESGEATRRFIGHTEDVRSVAFSSDGSSLVSGSNDNSVRLWNAETGEEILRFEGHTDDILTVYFSEDGKSILSGGRDTTARQWSIVSVDELILWTYENRYILGITCDERELYLIEPLCDAQGLYPTVTPYLTSVPVQMVASTQVASTNPTLEPTTTPTLMSTPIFAEAQAGENRGDVPINGVEGWTYTAEQGQILNVQIEADNPANGLPSERQVQENLMDTILYIVDADGDVVSTNNDTGGTSNSSIQNLEIEAGSYTIEVHSLARDTGGMYTLSIEIVPPSETESDD